MNGRWLKIGPKAHSGTVVGKSSQNIFSSVFKGYFGSLITKKYSFWKICKKKIENRLV